MSAADDPLRSLRFSLGLGVTVLGGAPLGMFAVLAAQNGGPDFPASPVWVAAPFVLAGVSAVVRGMVLRDPRRAARALGAGAGLVLVGDLILYGLRALLI